MNSLDETLSQMSRRTPHNNPEVSHDSDALLDGLNRTASASGLITALSLYTLKCLVRR